MRRTTKAMARLATLAVIAGGALSAPFAIGTANATVTPTAVVNGTVTSVEDAGAQSYYPNDGLIRWTAAGASTISLSGTGAYFILGANQGADTGSNGDATAGNVTVTSPTTANCAASPCAAHIGDSVAEAVTAFISDSAATSSTVTLNFNGIFLNGCPSTGLETGNSTGVNFGTPSQNTAQNCVTQGQFGQPLTLSGKYLAGGAGAAQGIRVFSLGGNQIFSGTQTGTCSFVSINQVDCTTDAAGNFSYTLTNIGAGNPPPAEQDVVEAITRNGAGTYPPIVTIPPAPLELVNWGTGGVTPTRVDVTAGQVIAPNPSGQSTGASPLAEPGDVEQGTFQVQGSCTVAAGFQNCDNGTLLAGVTVTVTVDHGFITPNCISAGFTSYAECTFASTPAAGTQVGNLKSLGTSATFTTGVDGTFKASFAIGRDAALDANGVLPVHVTVASLPTMLPGALAVGTTCSSPNASVVPLIPGGGGGPIVTGTIHGGCPIDGGWTTNEQPLNGGTAKLLGVAALSSPNNVAIFTENNTTPSDSGTLNVPDVNRVVFEVSLTDQFGNLTSNAGAGTPNAATLTKTGPGKLWNCGLGAFTSTDPCTAGTNGGRITNTQLANGQFTEVFNAVGSFTNLANQNRYQVDTAPNGGPRNSGYGTVTISVNDGTTTVVLSWTPPTTTFASYHAGTPAIATFTTGNGTAVTDTYTLNFYNQLSQPVVTFSVKPGSSVRTSTSVTVQATIVDQNGNPIVIYGGPLDPVTLQVLRTGGNESSCVPQQNGFNGGPLLITTNTSGVGAYTFSCNAAGLSTISMVVQGPGGVQLAQGQEAVTFTGPPPTAKKNETPTVAASSHRAGVLHLVVTTHPAVGHKTVKVYRLVNGLPKLIGQLGTNGRGVGTATFTGLRRGATYHIVVLVTGLGSGYNSHYSRAVTVHIHR